MRALRGGTSLALIAQLLACDIVLSDKTCNDSRALGVSAEGPTYSQGVITVTGACRLYWVGDCHEECSGEMTGPAGSKCEVSLTLPDGHVCKRTITLGYQTGACSGSLEPSPSGVFFQQPGSLPDGGPPDECWE